MACICMAACKPHGNDIEINGGDTIIFSLVKSYYRNLGIDTVTYVSDHGDTAILQLDVYTNYQPPVEPHFTAEGWSKDEMPEICNAGASVIVLQGDKQIMPMWIDICSSSGRSMVTWMFYTFPPTTGDYIKEIQPQVSTYEEFFTYLSDSVFLDYCFHQEKGTIPDAALIVRNRGLVWFKQYAKGATAENPTVTATWYLQE